MHAARMSRNRLVEMRGIFVMAAALLVALPFPSAAAFVTPVRLSPCLRHAPVSASLPQNGATSLRAPLEERVPEAGARSSTFAGARGVPRTVLRMGIGDTIKGWFGEPPIILPHNSTLFLFPPQPIWRGSSLSLSDSYHTPACGNAFLCTALFDTWLLPRPLWTP